MNLGEMSRDILGCIAGYLETVSLTRLALTTRRMHALFGRHEKVLRWREFGTKKERIAYACAIGDSELAEWSLDASLLEYGLCEAVFCNQEHLVRFYIQSGAREIWHVISDAAFSGQLPMVKLLLSYGPPRNAEHALVGAARGGHLHIILFLIFEHGATDIDVMMDFAVLERRGNVLLYFLKRGVRLPEDKMQDVIDYFYPLPIPSPEELEILNELLVYAALHGFYKEVLYFIYVGSSAFERALAVTHDENIAAVLRK